MKCHVCGKGPFESSLHRQNEKGVKGVWACREHNTKPIDPIVNQIVTLIEEDNDRNPR